MLPSRWVTAFLAGLCGVCLAGILHGKEHDSEQDLQARIQSERNSVKKAKFEIRLGRLKLNQAEANYNDGNVQQGEALLIEYTKAMEAAWQTLRDSGRNAARQPQGFKELEMALREGTRRLEDLKHRISYFDRDPVDKTQQGISKERSAVLEALFPTLQSAPKAKPRHFVAPGAASWRPWP